MNSAGESGGNCGSKLDASVTALLSSSRGGTSATERALKPDDWYVFDKADDAFAGSSDDGAGLAGLTFRHAESDACIVSDESVEAPNAPAFEGRRR